MAKKIINVVYKVDDGELVKVKAQIQSIEKATKASSDAMTKGNKAAGQSIESMTIQMQRLLAQIRLTNQADTQRIATLKTEYQALKTKVDDFNKSLNDTNKSGQQGTGIFGGLGSAIKAALSVAALKQLISFTLEMNKLAGQVEGVKRAFDIAFINAPLVLDNLKEHTHGTLSEFELMQRTLQATNLGVSVEHLGTLFEFATVRAQQTGESVDYLVDSVVRGIGRKSLLVLDNLGLSAVRLREQFGGVAIASKSVAEVTEGVAAIAKVELEKMGGYAETGAQRVDKVTVAWQGLKKEFAKKIESENVTSVFEDILRGFELMLKSSKEIESENILEIAVGNVKTFLGEQKRSIDETIQEINSLEKQYFSFREEIRMLSEEFIKLRDERNVANIERMDQIRDEITSIQFSNKVISQQIKLLNDYGNELIKTGKKTEHVPGLIEALKDQIDNLNDEIKEATSEEGIKRLNGELNILNAELKRLQNLKPIDIKKVMGLSESLAKDAEGKEAILPDVIIPKDEEEERYQESLKLLEKYGDNVSSEIDEQDKIRHNQEVEAAKERTRIANEEAANKQAAIQRTYDLAIQLGAALLESAFMQREIDTQGITEYYDNQIRLAGDNDKAKEQIERERDKKLQAAELRNKEIQKKNARTKIAIDTIVAVIKTFSQFGYPTGILPAALMTALGAVAAKNVGKYKKGEVNIDGPGTGTSDSIPAMISRGESVINATATSRSKNLLEAINDRKIDDRILSGAAASGGSRAVAIDYERLGEEFRKGKESFDTHGYTLMKGIQKGKNFKQFIRSKVQGY